MEKIAEKTGVQKEEINSCIGVLKKKAAIILDKRIVKITEQGKKLLEKEDFEEKLLKRISQGGILSSLLSPEEKFAYDNLKKRKQIFKNYQLKK